MKKFLWLAFILILAWAGVSVYVLSKAPASLFVASQREHSHEINDFVQNYQRDFVLNKAGQKIEIITIPNPDTADVVVYFHGNSGRIPDIITALSKVATVISPSYPGYSQSGGTPTEDGVYETVDLTMRFVKSKGYDYSHVTVLGHSLGGTAAAYAGARYQDIQRVIFVNTLDSVYSICKTKYSIFCGLTYWYFNSGILARQIKVHTTVFHDKGDTVIPYDQGQELFNNVGSKDKRFEAIEGTHSDFGVAHVMAY